jgi:hypothetical protein
MDGRLAGRARGRVVNPTKPRGSQGMASSKASLPRLPVTVMRRSGRLQLSVARTGAWPRNPANRPTTGAFSASISGSPRRCSDHVSISLRRPFTRRPSTTPYDEAQRLLVCEGKVPRRTGVGDRVVANAIVRREAARGSRRSPGLIAPGLSRLGRSDRPPRRRSDPRDGSATPEPARSGKRPSLGVGVCR